MWVGCLWSSSLEVSLAFLFAEYLFAECWFGPSLAILQDVLPPAARGSASGLFTALTLFGNAAPYAIGRVVGRGGGAPSLRDALGVAVPYGLGARRGEGLRGAPNLLRAAATAWSARSVARDDAPAPADDAALEVGTPGATLGERAARVAPAALAVAHAMGLARSWQTGTWAAEDAPT